MQALMRTGRWVVVLLVACHASRAVGSDDEAREKRSRWAMGYAINHGKPLPFLNRGLPAFSKFERQGVKLTGKPLAFVGPNGPLFAKYERNPRLSWSLSGGTSVRTNAGPIPVASLKRGSQIWAYDMEEKRRLRVEVTRVRKTWEGQMVEINDKLLLAPDHPLFVSGQWVPAGDLRTGAQITCTDGVTVPVEEITRVEGRFPVYEVSVRFPHFFFAGGVIVQ